MGNFHPGLKPNPMDQLNASAVDHKSSKSSSESSDHFINPTSNDNHIVESNSESNSYSNSNVDSNSKNTNDIHILQKEPHKNQSADDYIDIFIQLVFIYMYKYYGFLYSKTKLFICL